MATLKNTTINDTGHITIPIGTTAQRPGAPTAGMYRYNSDLGRTEYYNGSDWINPLTGETSFYETVRYVLNTSNLTITNEGSTSVNIFKTAGSSAWDSQFFSTSSFTAPCTIEFNKNSGSSDNGLSYAMIGWNEDPLTNASYDSIDHASYPYATSAYVVYNNGTLTQNGGVWSTSSKFYLSYGTDGYIRHYNGSTSLYSANYGTGKTVYVDSSIYSVSSTYGGFSNIRVCKFIWNGSAYTR